MSSILVELEFAVLVFVGGRKTGEPGEKPSGQDENKNKLTPDMALSWNRTMTLFPCCNYKLTINGLTTGGNYGLDEISDFYFLPKTGHVVIAFCAMKRSYLYRKNIFSLLPKLVTQFGNIRNLHFDWCLLKIYLRTDL